MKIKEKYHRILTAKTQWQEQLGIKEYIQPSVCTEKIEKYLLKKYKRWGIVEDSHCCYGWEKCCWEDPYEEGIWDMTEDDVVRKLKGIFKEARKFSSKMPIFYLYEHENKVEILITYRHLTGRHCIDYKIYGE